MTSQTSTQRSNLQFNWLVIILLLPLTFAVCLWQHFNGLYGQEPHEIQRYMQNLFAFLTGGPAPAAQTIPVIYPLAGAIFNLIIPTQYTLQFVNLVAAGFCYISFCRLLNLMYPEGTQRQRFAFLILFLSPFYFRAAVSGLADMLSMAFVINSLLECYRWNKTKSSTSLILALGTGLLALQTRYSTGLLLIPLLPMLWTAMRSRLSLFLILIFTILITLTPSIFLKGQDGLDFLLHPWLFDWSPLNLFRSAFDASGNKVSYTLPNALYLFSLLLHPGFCIIGIVFIIYSINTRVALPFIWNIGLGLFLLFIGGLPVQDLRLLLPAFPIALLALYPAYEKLIYKLPSRNQRVIAYMLAVIVQTGLSVRVLKPVYNYQQEEYKIAEALKKLPAGTLNTFAIDGALRTYNVPQEIVNMWSTASPLFNAGDLLLYNPQRFNSQYPESEPVKTFQRLRRTGRLMFIASYDNGWELYRIKN